MSDHADASVPPQYDPLTALREVKRILDRREHTKRGLREQRADAIIALAGTLGFHDARQLYQEADHG